MKKTLMGLLLLILGFSAAADGLDLIARWSFDKGSAFDDSGKYLFYPRKNSTVAETGLVLTPVDDKEPGGAIAKQIYPELTPGGMFKIKIEFVMDEHFYAAEKRNQVTLWDNKYIISPKDNSPAANSGFMLMLSKDTKAGFCPCLYVGYGDKSAAAYGRAMPVEFGKKHVIEADFDPAGKVRFFFDGGHYGEANVPAGNIASSVLRTVIGDRVAANYKSFGGSIRKVELFKINPDQLKISGAGRQVFMRQEKTPDYQIKLTNSSTIPIKSGKLSAKIQGGGITPFFESALNEITAEKPVPACIKLDTNLMPGDYQIEVKVEFEGKIITQNVPVTIVEGKGNLFPVVLWGAANLAKIKEAGFTHVISPPIPADGDVTENVKVSGLNDIDRICRAGLLNIDYLHLHKRYMAKKMFQRVARDGQPYKTSQLNVEASNPQVVKEVAELMQNAGTAFGCHPGIDGVLINSEIRDGSKPSFNPCETGAFKKFSGFDIPEDVNDKMPPHYRIIKNFPKNRILPDNYPLLVYYRWFWNVGDGWNNLHSAASKAYKHGAGRDEIWTFYDPATRVPPQWGSGGDVDVIEQWTYTNPDPIKIGQAVDELRSMAAGRQGQKIMAMTQAFYYRSQVAPKDTVIENSPAWVKEYEKYDKANYISIAPDALREALWMEISRRIDGVMYHGHQSLIEKSPSANGYIFTNAESKYVLRDLSKHVIQPLGPVLKSIPERKPEIVILQSFAPAIFCGSDNHTFGWSRGWAADIHLAMQWGHLQPDIFYDEHLLRGDLNKDVKVLVLAGCEVLQQRVLDKIKEFQGNGGIIVADETPIPEIMPDIIIRSYKRTGDAMADKLALQKLGQQIRSELEGALALPYTSDNQDMVLYMRSYKDADYLFVINDKRTFGEYIGQWRRVMEKGLPNNGLIIVNNKKTTAYDLVTHREIELQTSNGGSSFKSVLSGGEGQLVLLLNQRIDAMNINSPDIGSRGENIHVNIDVKDSSGKYIEAILPLEVTLKDANGNQMPNSGFYACFDGKININFMLPKNAVAGKAELSVVCLANNLMTKKSIIIE